MSLLRAGSCLWSNPQYIAWQVISTQIFYWTLNYQKAVPKWVPCGNILCCRNEFILDFLLFMTLKSNTSDGEKDNTWCCPWRYLYIGDEGINWHTFSGKLFGNLRLKYGHNLWPSNSAFLSICSKEIINHSSVSKQNQRNNSYNINNYMLIIPQ